MKMSKEVRTGIVVSTSLLIFILGFYFLKGMSLFSGDKNYYCVFKNVRGLQNQATVEINGLNIGSIGDSKLIPGQGVQVAISLHKNITLPEGTTATLATADLLGAKVITLELGKGPGNIKPGSTLVSKEEAGMMENVSDKITPILTDLKSTVVYLDTAIQRVNSIIGPANRGNIDNIIVNLSTTSNNLSQLSAALGKQSNDIAGVIHNTNSITANLTKSNDDIHHILSNFKNISGQLAGSPIQKTVTELKNTLTELDQVLAKINNGEGSAGQLVNSKDMYNNLNATLASLHSLLDDFQAHPKKYISVSVFGGKAK